MARKPSARARGNKKTSVKKSLSFSPKAWGIIQRRAKLAAKQKGTEANYSETATNLIIFANDHLTKYETDPAHVAHL